MTTHWLTKRISQNIQSLVTINEAVDRLLTILDSEDKIYLAGMPETRLVDLHLTLGMAIRNAFKRHDPMNPLLVACSTIHPDDASEVIIHSLWLALQRDFQRLQSKLRLTL